MPVTSFLWILALDPRQEQKEWSRKRRLHLARIQYITNVSKGKLLWPASLINIFYFLIS
jgi:hypothetical protein